jgi:hypothetical protein
MASSVQVGLIISASSADHSVLKTSLAPTEQDPELVLTVAIPVVPQISWIIMLSAKARLAKPRAVRNKQGLHLRRGMCNVAAKTVRRSEKGSLSEVQRAFSNRSETFAASCDILMGVPFTLGGSCVLRRTVRTSPQYESKARQEI